MQRICKYGDIQNGSHTQNKKQNILIYGLPSTSSHRGLVNLTCCQLCHIRWTIICILDTFVWLRLRHIPGTDYLFLCNGYQFSYLKVTT